MGDIGVEVEDPQGKNTVELLVEDKGNQVYRCVYKPLQPGPHVVKVSFAGDTIPKSPFVVQVGEGECWDGQVDLPLMLRLMVHTSQENSGDHAGPTPVPFLPGSLWWEAACFVLKRGLLSFCEMCNDLSASLV